MSWPAAMLYVRVGGGSGAHDEKNDRWHHRVTEVDGVFTCRLSALEARPSAEAGEVRTLAAQVQALQAELRDAAAGQLHAPRSAHDAHAQGRCANLEAALGRLRGDIEELQDDVRVSVLPPYPISTCSQFVPISPFY